MPAELLMLIDLGRAECDQPVDLGPPVGYVAGSEIEVQPVLAVLGLGHLDEHQRRPGT